MVNWRNRSFTRLAKTLIGIVGVIVLAGGLVFGQNFSAAISGFVRDTTGAVVPGTTVTAKHTETGLTRTVQTSEEGGYTMPSLPVGSYEVTAEKPGFRQQVRRGITLVVAQEAVVNLTLDVGDLVEKVTVTEETPIVNTTLSSVSGLINQQQVKELPLNGRSYNDLLLLNTRVDDNRSNTGAGGPCLLLIDIGLRHKLGHRKPPGLAQHRHRHAHHLTTLRHVLHGLLHTVLGIPQALQSLLLRWQGLLAPLSLQGALRLTHKGQGFLQLLPQVGRQERH